MDPKLAEIATQVAVEVGKEAYKDLVQPTAKVTGEILALLPRSIKASLLPLEKWILNKENSLDEVVKLLALKLVNVPPENIVPLEAYVGVPALQQINYCMDNVELRNMYANLLARAMNKDTKNNVHPSFVEIIKQLSPNEALLLKYIYTEHQKDNTFYISALSINEVYENRIHTQVVDRFFSIPHETNYDMHNSKFYFDNLLRLQLIRIFETGFFGDKVEETETELDHHAYIVGILEEIIQKNLYPWKSTPTYHAHKYRTIYDTTSYGINFAKTCILE